MFNFLGATPPVHTTTDYESFAFQDLLPILIVFLFISLMFCVFLIFKKIRKYMNEQKQLKNLKEYKKLLDEGLITQEEYEKKKKQILNM